jgi:hypothetical protein
MDVFAAWVKTTDLSWFVNHYPWVWPLSEALHFAGLSLLLGIVGVFDLRCLGLMRRMPVGPLLGLMPWAIAGFAVNLVTGVLFFAGEPSGYIHNPVFFLKLALMLIAGINALLFNFVAFHETVAVGAGESAPRRARLCAATSLFCWVAVLYCGRMLPFLGNAF